MAVTLQFYDLHFLALAATCGLLKYYQSSRGRRVPSEPVDEETSSLEEYGRTLEKMPAWEPGAATEMGAFKRVFLTVYALAMGADWLQGAYIYALYKDEIGLSSPTIATLFTTGFLAAGVSGLFIGVYADRYGRKTACLAYCAIYTVSCLSMLSDSLNILLLGRLLGGVSASLLYTVFESWMVAEFGARKLDQRGGSLSDMFGAMTTLNATVAIAAGVLSEWLVRVTGTMRAPFMASVVALIAAAGVMWNYWSENYGDSHLAPAKSSTQTDSILSQLEGGLKTILENKRIFVVGLASTLFEGSLFLFVFFWSPALKAVATSRSHTTTKEGIADESQGESALPFGMIFACLMAAMMIGSLLFGLFASSSKPTSPTRILPTALALASSSLLVPVVWRKENLTFWSFLVFEACAGVYWPSIGLLKGKLIEDGVRARVYALLKIPLNFFVVTGLTVSFRGNGGEGYRDWTFVVCSGCLLVASKVLHLLGPIDV